MGDHKPTITRVRLLYALWGRYRGMDDHDRTLLDINQQPPMGDHSPTVNRASTPVRAMAVKLTQETAHTGSGYLL
jgi:hypothetical protein